MLGATGGFLEVTFFHKCCLHVDLFARCQTEEGLGNGDSCPVSYSSGCCLPCGYSWRSAFDVILLCFENRLFLSHRVNPNPDLVQ